MSWRTKTSLQFHFFQTTPPPPPPPVIKFSNAALILSSVVGQLQEAAAASSWQKHWDNILYIVEDIYYALSGGKTDWRCNNSKQKWQNWLRLIDSRKRWWKKAQKTQDDVFNFPPLPLTCHHLTGSNFPSAETCLVHLYDTFMKAQPASHESRGSGKRAMGGSARQVRPCSRLLDIICGLLLVSWHFVTGHLLWCHWGHPCRTVASWMASQSIITCQRFLKIVTLHGLLWNR